MDIFLFIFIWVFAVGLVMRDYIRFSKKEREEVLQLLKKPAFLFSDGAKTLGLILFCSGMIRTFAFLKLVGISLIIVGGLTSGALLWESNKKRSLVIILITSMFFFLYLNGLVTKFL